MICRTFINKENSYNDNKHTENAILSFIELSYVLMVNAIFRSDLICYFSPFCLSSLCVNLIGLFLCGDALHKLENLHASQTIFVF